MVKRRRMYSASSLTISKIPASADWPFSFFRPPGALRGISSGELTDSVLWVELLLHLVTQQKYVRNPNMVHLPLALLHEALFSEAPTAIHNAEKDAAITAKCYFEMMQRAELSEEDISKQQGEFNNILS
ncbi:hypothetical protein KUH03_22810 [Sphingobacterium sp. E70]|uniref:hypothetical protein n=1 Tax=Sphingobacterium sp. E70 TaxID=2853439 RepID=UPI00211BF190|nr:hypothetical protein [Sphingobacterium sp. E70]ULT22281.1 hypothetical protein KUH03_22810 [Sphingobacterium sp. E70]